MRYGSRGVAFTLASRLLTGAAAEAKPVTVDEALLAARPRKTGARQILTTRCIFRSRLGAL